jgi:hypothetical protein
MEHPMKFRFLAGLLAAGGVLWGLLASAFVFRTLASLVFIPGYIITVGYIIRCFSTPRLSWRRVIWGASVFVQGAWVIFYFGAYGVMYSSGDSHSVGDVANLMTLWWIFALGISIYGYRFDKRPAA